MAFETILQHEILTKFAYPFLLIFFILFAVLEKTEIFGKDKKQLNALLSFVVGLIFVSAFNPKLIVADLILFLTIGVVIVFIVLLLWGFVNKGEVALSSGVKKVAAVVIVIAVIIAILITTNVHLFGVFDFLFKSGWSGDFWTNAIFVVVIAVALALMMKKTTK